MFGQKICYTAKNKTDAGFIYSLFKEIFPHFLFLISTLVFHLQPYDIS